MELDKFTFSYNQIHKNARKDILRGLCIETSVVTAAEACAVKYLWQQLQAHTECRL
jgi:hypothetical protein